jgi:hypothetical protein
MSTDPLVGPGTVGYVVVFLSGGLLQHLEIHPAQNAAAAAIRRLVDANGFSSDLEEYQIHSWQSGSEVTSSVVNLGNDKEYYEWAT